MSASPAPFGCKALAAALLALAASSPLFAQDREEDEAPDLPTAQERREARRIRNEGLSQAARRIVWQAPEELKELFEKHVAPPEMTSDRERTDRIRPYLREVNRRVPQIAAAEGYFSAQVEARAEGEGEERRLVVVVTPGPRTTIDRVILEFEGDIANEDAERDAQREEVRRAWTLPAGKFFRQADWDEAKARILEKLSERHYAAAQVADSVAIVDAPAATATLKVILESGPRFTTGDVAIDGLKRYPEALVRRYTAMNPGDAFNLDSILEFQRRLQNSPWFASVAVDVERDVARPERVPVRVSVIERAPVDVGLSVGYGTDTGARGEISLRHRNALGYALDMQSALAVDKTRQVGYADFYLPPLTLGGPFADRFDTRDSFGALGERKENQGLVTERVAFAAYRQFKVKGSDYRVGLSYQFERKKPDGADESIARALSPVGEVTWRWIDDILDPRKGGILKMRLAGGARSLLSTQDFVQTYALYQHWFPISADDQIIVRGEVGRTIAASREGIPEDFLFRAGGTRSVRGYEFESLGARDGDAVVGGRVLLTASTEYVHWFSKQWGGALFYDVGDAADTRDELSANRSYGFGARWRTPAGPLAFDLAYAEADKKWRLSFSVSIAF